MSRGNDPRFWTLMEMMEGPPEPPEDYTEDDYLDWCDNQIESTDA